MRMRSAISRNGGGDSGLHFLGALGGGQAVSARPSNLRKPSSGRPVVFPLAATPSDPLYEYRPPDSPLWERDEEASSEANVVLAGHIHLQFARRLVKRTVVNPGSLGQSKAGDPRARYAVWQDGDMELKAYEYPVEKTVVKIRALPVADEVKRDLVHVLRTGMVP